MSRNVFIRDYDGIAKYTTGDALSPNSWTYVLLARNQQFISVTGIMHLIRNKYVPPPPPPPLKQKIRKSPSVKNIKIC
jgi:hypothetical protein